MRRRQKYLIVRYPAFNIYIFLFYNVVFNLYIAWISLGYCLAKRISDKNEMHMLRSKIENAQ